MENESIIGEEGFTIEWETGVYDSFGYHALQKKSY